MDEDEAYVETEEDPLVPDTEPESQPPPQMPNLWILWFKHYLSNPWVLIILFLFFYFYVFKKFWPKIQNHWNDWRAKNEEAKVIADMKKNPDLYRQKIEAMDAIRRRQQETYEAAARLLAEKQREKDEEKQRQRLEDLENLVSGKGYRNKSDLRGQDTTQEQQGTSGQQKIKKKPLLRPEYNPLMGDSGGSSGYRRRDLGGSGGGG